MSQEIEKNLASAPVLEQQPVPESGAEAARETGAVATRETKREPATESTPASAPAPAMPPAAMPAPAKDPETVAIETILAEDLEEAYKTMTPAAQAKFRARGELVAQKIRVLVAKAHAHAKSVLRLIRDWLRLIPGMNRFFLDQEAKIKTDKILDYVETQKGEPLP